MRLTKFNSIDEILEELVWVFINHNGSKPMDWTPARKNVMFSLSEDFTERVFQLDSLIDDLLVENIYVSPSHYIKMAHKFQNACKSLAYSKNDVAKTYLNMCNNAVVRWQRDVKDILISMPEKVFIESSDNNRISVAYFNSLVRAFCEAIYCDDHTIGGDIVGPLDDKNGVLIVRQYIRLRPIELFDIMQEFKYESVISNCIYDDSSDIQIDLIGNLSKCDNMVSSLKSYCIEVIDTNGIKHQVTDENLEEYIEYFERWLTRITSHFQSLTINEQYRIMFDCEFYAIKPLLDKLSIPWVPKSYELKDISQKPPVGITLRNKLATAHNERERIIITKRILDPRL